VCNLLPIDLIEIPLVLTPLLEPMQQVLREFADLLTRKLKYDAVIAGGDD
jgi:hypothetical protein